MGTPVLLFHYFFMIIFNAFYYQCSACDTTVCPLVKLQKSVDKIKYSAIIMLVFRDYMGNLLRIFWHTRNTLG